MLSSVQTSAGVIGAPSPGRAWPARGGEHLHTALPSTVPPVVGSGPRWPAGGRRCARASGERGSAATSFAVAPSAAESFAELGEGSVRDFGGVLGGRPEGIEGLDHLVRQPLGPRDTSLELAVH